MRKEAWLDRRQGTGWRMVCAHRQNIQTGIPPTWTHVPSHGCPEAGGIVQETLSLSQFGCDQKASDFMEKEESSFMLMVWASHRRGSGVPQPGLTERRGVSEVPSQAEGRVRAGRIAEKQGQFPRDRVMPHMVSGTESWTQNQCF